MKKKTEKKKPDFKDDSIAELTVKSRDLKQEIFNLRLQQASGQLEKPSRVRKLRKDVARIETQISVLRNKKAA
jgi:large subunit ribosomal protein L29